MGPVSAIVAQSLSRSGGNGDRGLAWPFLQRSGNSTGPIWLQLFEAPADVCIPGDDNCGGFKSGESDCQQIDAKLSGENGPGSFNLLGFREHYRFDWWGFGRPGATSKATQERMGELIMATDTEFQGTRSGKIKKSSK